jgi:hypothetical protein
VQSQANGRIFNEKQLAEIAQSILITQLSTQLAQVIRDEDSLNSRFGFGPPAWSRSAPKSKG